MEYFHNCYCWLLCLISLKGLESSKIYVFDIPIAENRDSLPDYDEYGITYDYDKVLLHRQQNRADQANERANIVLCQRLFGSIYGNRDRDIRCLKALKKNRANIEDFGLPKEKFDLIKTHLKGLQDQASRQQYQLFSDLSRFSQDYLDVNDLARTNFASDYVDINDFRNTRSVLPACKNELDEFDQSTKSSCLPVSRKTLAIDNGHFKVDDSNQENILRRKNKRYKVISKSDESRSGSDESETFEDNFGSGSSIQNSDSIEVTTKRPKKKNKKLKREFADSYFYLQGNKKYDHDNFRRNKFQYFRNGNDDEKVHPRFRRGLRLSTFLPKRFHWDEDEYQNLGYYWFNGPRGKYRNS